MVGPASGAGASATPRVHLLPQDALLDAPLRVEATGLSPAARHMVRLSTRDASGRRWHATRLVRADTSGELRLDGAALIPAMLPVGYSSLQPLDVSLFPLPRGGLEVTVEVRVEGRTVGRTTALRRVTGKPVSRRLLSLPRDGLVGRYSTIPGGRKRPAVLLLGGSQGGLSRTIASDLLAARGFNALELAYFGIDGLPPALERIPLEYFERALRWLARQPGVDRNRIWVLGRSRGAELSLILGSRFPSLVYGVAAYAPSSYVVPAVGGAGPAWTHHGTPIPHVPLGGGWPDPRSKQGRAAAIAVERIRGPILVVAGDDDLVWPAGRFARAIARRLHAHDKRDFASIVYDHAGHAVTAVMPLLPLATFSQQTIGGGGHPEADARARTAAWTVLRRMLERP